MEKKTINQIKEYLKEDRSIRVIGFVNMTELNMKAFQEIWEDKEIYKFYLMDEDLFRLEQAYKTAITWNHSINRVQYLNYESLSYGVPAQLIITEKDLGEDYPLQFQVIQLGPKPKKKTTEQ